MRNRSHTLLMLGLLGACGEEPEILTDHPAAARPARNIASSLSDADFGRVCRATVADINGHPPSIIKVDEISGGIAQVSYNRPSDGKRWSSQCRVEGDRVIWRTVDAFGAGSGLGRWRDGPYDETIRFVTEGSEIEITQSYPDGSGASESYVVN